MWVRRCQWEELWDTARQASGALFELEEARAESAALWEQVKRLQRENAELRDELLAIRFSAKRRELLAAGLDDPDPSRRYIPREHGAGVPTAEQWNALYPIGTEVVAYPGGRDGTPLHTSTRSKAWTLGHGEPVVSVHGRTGGIGLAFVDPVEPREFGAEELAESEAAVVPCPTCGQPHGSGGVCAGDVREAA